MNHKQASNINVQEKLPGRATLRIMVPRKHCSKEQVCCQLSFDLE